MLLGSTSSSDRCLLSWWQQATRFHCLLVYTSLNQNTQWPTCRKQSGHHSRAIMCFIIHTGAHSQIGHAVLGRQAELMWSCSLVWTAACFSKQRVCYAAVKLLCVDWRCIGIYTWFLTTFRSFWANQSLKMFRVHLHLYFSVVKQYPIAIRSQNTRCKGGLSIWQHVMQTFTTQPNREPLQRHECCYDSTKKVATWKALVPWLFLTLKVLKVRTIYVLIYYIHFTCSHFNIAKIWMDLFLMVLNELTI